MNTLINKTCKECGTTFSGYSSAKYCTSCREERRKTAREPITKEVYRSFDGLLNAETAQGYIIYEISDFYEIHFHSVYANSKSEKYRVAKDSLDQKDFSDICKISEIIVDIKNGCRKGQVYYKNKWYSQELINKIQYSHKDYEWKKYV